MCGKPLIYYTISEALKSNVTSVVVSSDDDEILKISKRFGAAVIKRPKSLSSDKSPSYLALRHALFESEAIEGFYFDRVLLLQPTSPLRTYEMINDALSIPCDAVMSAERVSLTEFKLNGAIFLVSRQVFKMIKEPEQYLIDDIMKLNIYTSLLITNNCVDIDTIDDFTKAEVMMMTRDENDKNGVMHDKSK